MDGEERKERWLRYVIWALEVGGILFLSKWLFLREVLNGILAALIVIVPIIIWYFVVLIKSDDASKACLPDYVKAIVEEDEKGNLEKTGDINMIQYDHILGE